MLRYEKLWNYIVFVLSLINHIFLNEIYTVIKFSNNLQRV